MQIRIGINGFGRIGRNAARVILQSRNITLAAINSNSDPGSHSYLLTHDSSQGTFPLSVTSSEDSLIVGSQTVRCTRIKNVSEIPWTQADVDVVLECTGKFRTTQDAGAHVGGSVRRVVISAPAKDDTPTFVMGVNHKKYSNKPVVSNSSCTTNCVTTVIKVLEDAFGVICGSMTTVHAATDSQNLLDNSHPKEVRLRRNSLMNLIPAASGSSRDVAKLFPHLQGLLPCRAIRVPTSTVSLIELVVLVSKKTTAEAVNAAFEAARQGPMKGILAVAAEELVSSDYIGNPNSAIVDPFLTDVVDQKLVHVTAWYDNEWGYANRLVELAAYITTGGKQ